MTRGAGMAGSDPDASGPDPGGSDPGGPDAARALVLDVLRTVAPGPELDGLGPRDDLRDTLGLDSLDFLAVVTRVSERTGRRIEEDDYDRLADLDGWVALLTGPGTAPESRP